MKDPITSIGKLLTGDEQRDAIHIAIMPAIAAEELERGNEVGLVYGTSNQIRQMDSVYDNLPAIGVVDPFFGLKKLVGDEWPHRFRIKKGERCWVFLYPNTVTGIRHHWEHPAIDNVRPPKNEAEKWLKTFADKWNFDYDQMIEGASSSRGYVVAQGMDLHDASELAPGEEELFWKHIETLTGQKGHRESFTWSCSC